MRQRYVPELQGLEARHVLTALLGPARPDALADAVPVVTYAPDTGAEGARPAVAAPDSRPDAATALRAGPADPVTSVSPPAERPPQGSPVEKALADNPAPAQKVTAEEERGPPGPGPPQERPAARITALAKVLAWLLSDEAHDAELSAQHTPRRGEACALGGPGTSEHVRPGHAARGPADGGRPCDAPPTPGKVRAAVDRQALVRRLDDFGAPDGGAVEAVFRFGDRPGLSEGWPPDGPPAPAGDELGAALGLAPAAAEGLEGDALGEWLGDFCGPPAGVLLALAGPADRQQGGCGDGGETPPWYLAAFVPRTGRPHDPAARGYEYLCNYARSAIRAAERRFGPLLDHDDIVQQVALEWLEQVGPAEEAFPRLLEQAPAEMEILRDTVSRVIARAVYRQKKREVALPCADWPAPTRPTARAWAEFQSDCERGVGRLTPLEWRILDARRQGKTFEEIGTELNVSKQRACEACQAAIARLQKIYGTEDD